MARNRIGSAVAAAVLTACTASAEVTPPPGGAEPSRDPIGTWDITMSGSQSARRWTLTLWRSGDLLIGELDMGPPSGTARMDRVFHAGSRLRTELAYSSHGMSGVITLEGRLEGNTMRGEVGGLPAQGAPARFVAVRRAADVGTGQ